MMYAAFVTVKETKEKIWVEAEYSTLKDFLFDLRRNGYAVSSKYGRKDKVDRIMSTTNGNDWDWHPRKYR